MARRKNSVVSRDDLAEEPILKRPDGFYWQRKSGGELRGPFVTRAEAEADRLAGGAADDDERESGDPLHEAEFDIGVSEWIEPDTGGPAEDHIPRLEDH
jgi:hypothetical protein